MGLAVSLIDLPDKTGVRVSEYPTVLPPREELEANLQRSLLVARQWLDAHEE